MVEYFFHKGCVLAEDMLIDENMKNVRSSREDKIKKAHGILKIIEPCAHVLEMNFPLQRDDGSYEMINAYRAQHSHHRSNIPNNLHTCKDNIEKTFDHLKYISELFLSPGALAREVSVTPWMSVLTR